MKRPFKIPKIVNFDAEKVAAPVLLRCAAFFLDYVLIVFFPVVTLVLGRVIGNDGSKLLNSELSNLGWMLALLIGLVNLVGLPLYTCQSIGKMATGLRVVGRGGVPATLKALLLRHTVGYFVTAVTLGLGFLPAIFSNGGRALHDRISGTYVIFAEESPADDSKD